MRNEISEYKNKLSLLDNYLLQYKPFTTSEIIKHIEQINISFKPGKKVATFSLRKINIGGKKIIKQRDIIAPRGPLSEESVYGKIYRKIVRTVKLDKKFSKVENIINEKERLIIKDRLLAFNFNTYEAFGDLKKEPIWLDKDQNIQLTEVAIIDYQPEYVIKYPVTGITPKDLQHVVDKRVREILADRLNRHNNNPKEAFKDIINNPIWLNEEKKIPIKTVRCFTGISDDSIIPIKVYDNTWEIEYEKYVKPANNHHVAIYKDENGKLQEHIVTFWHAVERKKYGIPTIIKKPVDVWDTILNNRELPQAFLDKLPLDKWAYITSMQQNECFVFNMSKDDLKMAIENKAYQIIAPNVFRVRKLTKGSFWFNQQYETTPRESVADKRTGRCIQASLSSMTGIKVKINLLGEIFIDE
jgi:CRISPR-associated endonuclease Csn1